jgi:hypothetical protein
VRKKGEWGLDEANKGMGRWSRVEGGAGAATGYSSTEGGGGAGAATRVQTQLMTRKVPAMVPSPHSSGPHLAVPAVQLALNLICIGQPHQLRLTAVERQARHLTGGAGGRGRGPQARAGECGE